MKSKARKAKKAEIKITLTFGEDDIQALLDAANFSDFESLTVSELMANNGRLLRKLKGELQDTAENFVYEIVDTARDACANDWLNEWGADWDDGSIPVRDGE